MRVVDTAQSVCRFGIARCDITPPVGIYHRMWGASTHDRSTGVHRPLTATAMVFEAADSKPKSNKTADGERVILIAVDHCLLWRKEMDDLLEVVSRISGAPLKELHVNFGHTHGAGLMGRERADLPGGDLVGPYLDALAEKIGEVVRQAIGDAEPVDITYGIGRCNLATHRDFWDEESKQIVCGYNPTGTTDDTVLIARVTRAGRTETKAIIVNYACHPTTLAWKNTLISPDYPGAMRELVEQASGALCVFLQGASGDIGPREGFAGDPTVADRNGRQLGYSVLSALETMPPAGTHYVYQGPVVSGATLGDWQHEQISDEQRHSHRTWRARSWNLRLPLREDLPTHEAVARERDDWQRQEAAARSAGDRLLERDYRAQAERKTRLLVKLSEFSADGTLELPATLWQIGDAMWLAVDSEFYNWFQRELRARHPGTPIIVATITNGWSAGYLVPREAYGRGIYQEQASYVAPGSLEQALTEVDAVVSEWSRLAEKPS